MDINNRIQLIREGFSHYSDYIGSIDEYRDEDQFLLKLFVIYENILEGNWLYEKNIISLQKMINDDYGINVDIEKLVNGVNNVINHTGDNNTSCSNNNEGYIYLLTNPSMPGVVKIGKTTRDPEIRVKELSSATGVPTPFTLVYKEYFLDCSHAENVIHNYLQEQGYRTSSNREFFDIPIPDAIDFIRSVKESLTDNSTPVDSSINNDNNAEISLADMIFKGQSHIYGLEDTIQDANEGLRILQMAGEVGSSEAYKLMAEAYLDSYLDDEGILKSNTKKALEYLEKGFNVNDIESNHCLAEIALIYSGCHVFNDDLKNQHNARVSWEKYIENLNLKNLNVDDEYYIKNYITNFLYDFKNYENEVFFEKSLIRISWIKYCYGREIIEKNNQLSYDDNENKFILNFLKERFTLLDTSENLDIDIVDINQVEDNAISLKVKIINGTLNTQDIIRISTRNSTDYINIKELKSKGQSVTTANKSSKIITIIADNTIKEYDILEYYIIQVQNNNKDVGEIYIFKTGTFNYINPKSEDNSNASLESKQSVGKIKNNDKTLLDKVKGFFK